MPVPKMSIRNRTLPDDFVSRQRDVRGRPVCVIGRSFVCLVTMGAGKVHQKLMAKNRPSLGLAGLSEISASVGSSVSN